MEDVLEVYQRPYDPLRPVVCIDETNKQLIRETRMPCEPGRPEKVDSVYVRNGVADVFMISEPLAGRRETVVTQTRTALDFAFYAGNPSEELVKYKPESCKPDFIIMVPQNAGWAELIEKGLAYACGAKLILECLEEGLYPSWDAQNKWSVALAEKLGYHFSHEYVAYEIMGY